MTAHEFYLLLGIVITTLAGVLFILLALARKITRNDRRLHDDDDFFDYR